MEHDGLPPKPETQPNHETGEQSAIGHETRDTIRSCDAQWRRDNLDYIGQIARELASMARDSRFELIAYFLDMAVIEAGTLRRKIKF